MKKLGRIAVAGIGVGFAASIIAAALPGSGMRHMAKSHQHWSHLLDISDDDDACDDDVAESGSEKHFEWDGGDSVVIAGPAKVLYRAGDGTDVIVRGTPSAVAQVRVHAGKIKSCRRRGSDSLEITLPGRAFQSLTLAGSGDVTMENVAQPDLNLTIAGSGNIRARGTAENVKVTIAGSGDAYLGELAATHLHVTIAGSGNTEASPGEDANVTIVGSGDVKLLTRPAHINTNIMGSGRVKQENGKPETNANMSPPRTDAQRRGCGTTILTLNVDVADDTTAPPRDCPTIVALNTENGSGHTRASHARWPHILM